MYCECWSWPHKKYNERVYITIVVKKLEDAKTAMIDYLGQWYGGSFVWVNESSGIHQFKSKTQKICCRFQRVSSKDYHGGMRGNGP